MVSKCDSNELGGIVVSGRDSSGLEGGIVASGRDLSRARGIVASRRDSGGLRESMDSFRCDLRGLGGRIEGFGCVHTVARFLKGTLRCNCCKAFRFVLLLA
jgi:hypothetical protein